jgi:hypothetical protein
LETIRDSRSHWRVVVRKVETCDLRHEGIVRANEMGVNLISFKRYNWKNKESDHD